MSRRLIVPLDGSVFAEEALELALTMAEGGHLDLVTAVEGAPPFSVPEYDALARDWAERYLDSVTEKLPPTVGYACHVLVGVPIHELNDFIQASQADLVVMATHGRGPFSRAWLGSTADALMRSSTLPLFLVHPAREAEPAYQARGPIRKLLVPLDGSELAETAVKVAADLWDDPLEVTLLRVVHYPYIVSPYLPDTVHGNQEIFKQSTAQARDYLTEAAWKFNSDHVEVGTEVTVSEHPARAITDYAAENGFDAIAIATHGRSGLARLALGSVADKVIRTSNVPVLTFRPIQAEKRKAKKAVQTTFRSL